jgi:hypothetical protein
LAEVFLVLGTAIFFILASVAIASFTWAKTKSIDKYQRVSRLSGKVSDLDIDVTRTSNTNSEQAPEELDPISIWDSQR